MIVNIQITQPALEATFANVRLSFVDKQGITREVQLNIDFRSLNDFTKDTASPAFDLFFVSTCVYGIDNLLDRYQYSLDGWARDIEICFPVNNLSIWNGVKTQVEGVLSFLTGDYWTVTFSQCTITEFFKQKKNRRKSATPTFNYGAYKFVSLFSGGLDSLSGVIDQLEHLQPNQKGIFISHFDSTSPGPSSDQTRIHSYLNGHPSYANKIDWIQEVISLSNQDNGGAELIKDHNFRSRSLLFIGIGVYCANATPSCRRLIIPENGTISLNYPLTPSRSGTLSTRTTHPFYLRCLQEVIFGLGIEIELFNPLANRTKGELIEACLNQGVLHGIFEKSVSCGKRGRRQYWDQKSGTNHCGVCMPCIYRRAALHKLGWDNQTYGIDIFSTRKSILSIPDMPALFDFLSRSLTIEQLKRTLLVTGSLKLDELNNSALLVERSRQEIKRWISDKGDAPLKSLAGI